MKQKIIDKTTLRFLLVGVINTLVGYCVAFLCLNALGLNYWLSSAMNYVVGSILSYFLNKFFTFKKKGYSLVEVVKFIINIAVCYLLAYGIAKPLAFWIFAELTPTLKDNLAMLAGAGIFVVLNYFGQRFFAFKEK